MSMQDQLESDVLNIILNGVAAANLWDNAASSPLTNLFLALHTADPGDAGVAQTTSEADYPGYTRVAVARNPSSPAWTISGTTPTSASCGQKTFPASTGAGTTLTNFSVGTASTGAGRILFSGSLSSPITIPASPATSPQITPTITFD